MEENGSVFSWVIAGLAVVCLVCTAVWGFSQREQVRLERAKANEYQARAEALTVQVRQQDEQVRRLEQRLAGQENTPAAPASGTDASASASEVASSADGKPGADGQKDRPMSNMLEMFEGERGKQLAEASAESAMTMQYGDLFVELALPPEAEQKVRAIIRDFTVRLLRGSAEAMKNGGTGSVEKFENDLRAEMKAELSKVLTSEGMAIFDDYMASMNERMLRKGFQVQLVSVAPSLSEETRGMVVDVMVEEMMAAQDGAKAAGASADRHAIVLEALDRSRQRLSTVLDEQQMSLVDTMIQQQRMQFERMRQAFPQKSPES